MEPRHYRRRRRDLLVPAAVLEHPRLALLLVLVGVLAIVLTMKAVATGSPTPVAELPGVVVATSAAMSGVLPPLADPTPTARASREAPLPAVPLTLSPPPSIVPMTYSYEAEAPDAVRSPGTNVRTLPAASGGQLVDRIGDTRSVRFSGVLADAGGEYTLTICYVAPDARTAVVKVDDDVQTQVAFPALAPDQVGTVAFKVVLLVGVNTVEIISPAHQWGPDLDRITVRVG